MDWSKKLFPTATPTTVPRLAPATKSASQWLVIEPPKTLDACSHPHQGLTAAAGATSQKVAPRVALAYPRTVAQFQTEHTLKAMPPIASKARRMNHLFTFGLLLAASLMAGGADWIRPGLSTNQPVWGLWGGLLWAVAPGGFRAGEPRGLIRLGYPVLADKGYDLINFIAIEPVVRGRRGFSELEHSQLDGLDGKRIWAESAGGGATTNAAQGDLRKRPGTQEELEERLRVEKFGNGAHVRLVILQRSDRPDEIQLSVFREPDSTPLDYCILTATMGNMTRTRLLWLKDEVMSSLRVYQDYKETGFAPHRQYLSRACAEPLTAEFW